MKIAVFADVHGNSHALDAVLHDIEQHNVDLTLCAGDVINPFPDSLQVWEKVKARQIPTICGNHEEYVRTYFMDSDEAEMRASIQFRPLQHAGRKFAANIVSEINTLPKTLSISGPCGDDVLICHGSPRHTRQTFSVGIDPQMAEDLSAVSECLIVGAHNHIQWQQRWRDKQLVLSGSVDLPLNGRAAAQYLLLVHCQGGWQIEHKTVAYDIITYLHHIATNGYLAETGPIGWLYFDELWTADYRLVPFFKNYCWQEKPTTLADGPL